MKPHILMILSVVGSTLWSQQEIGSGRLDRLEMLMEESETRPQMTTGKCGTPLVFQALNRLPRMPATSRVEILQLLQRPSTHRARLSPSGRFRIHYDTSGVHQPAMIAGIPRTRVPGSHEEYVDSVGAIFDHCWEVEVEAMGFDAPPPDNGAGGGDEYDIYIQFLTQGTFGVTLFHPDDALETGPRQRYPSYIMIDVDFLGERTDGLDGIRVTAAHEFHHAIQVGAYAVWENVPHSDFWFYELTSVWLEEVLYDSINDYYFDLPVFFQSFKDNANRSLPFTAESPSGYERSVWALYLEKRFNRDIVRQIWEQMKIEPALFSMASVLQRHQFSLAAALEEFSVWNLFTAHRADPLLYYKEGEQFPVMRMNASSVFPGAVSTVSGSAFPLSVQYYRFILPGDTLFAAITNTNSPDAYAAPSRIASFDLMLSTEAAPGAGQELSNGLNMGFIAGSYEDWRTKYVGSASRTDFRNRSFLAPNPLVLSRSPLLTLPVDDGEQGSAEVLIVTSSLDLAFSGRYHITALAGKSQVTLPGADLAGQVSSGVHFVFLKTFRKEYAWKILIIR